MIWNKWSDFHGRKKNLTDLDMVNQYSCRSPSELCELVHFDVSVGIGGFF